MICLYCRGPDRHLSLAWNREYVDIGWRNAEFQKPKWFRHDVLISTRVGCFCTVMLRTELDWEDFSKRMFPVTEAYVCQEFWSSKLSGW